MTPQRNERAFTLLTVDALLRAHPLLSVCSDRPEARSPQTVLSLAGDFSPAFSTDTQFCAELQAWLRSDDPDCPPLDSNLGGLLASSDSTRLQTNSKQTARLAFQHALLWGTGVSLISHLQPFTPAGPAPFVILIRSLREARTCADVVGIILTTRTLYKSSAPAPTREPPHLLAEMLFVGIRHCWRKDGGVRGDEGEMLFVVAKVVRRCGCRCGDVV